jgi:hypothetical protein
MLALDRVSCFGQFTPGIRYVVGCVSPTTGLDHLQDITYFFLLRYFLNPNFASLKNKIIVLSLVGSLPVVVLDNTGLTIIVLK